MTNPTDTNQPDHIVDMHEMVTDTNQASELYELCKKVYERTGWEQEPDISYLYKYWDNHDELCVISIEEADDSLVPAYTSDYLLEKLPATVKNDFDGGNDYIILYKKGKSWYADYMGQFKRQESDTPLRALLKLTIYLSQAGEL